MKTLLTGCSGLVGNALIEYLFTTRVTPKVLLEAGYSFQDQSLDAVLRNCLTGKTTAKRS